MLAQGTRPEPKVQNIIDEETKLKKTETN